MSLIIIRDTAGSALVAVMLLVSAITIIIVGSMGLITSETRDTSSDLNRYLAESTARSCADLAAADTIAGNGLRNELLYGPEYFQKVRGRSLKCTALVKSSGSNITITATAVVASPVVRNPTEASFSKLLNSKYQPQ